VRMERVHPRGAVDFLIYKRECRALPVLGVRVRLTLGGALVFVPFSSLPRVYVVGACSVTTREGNLPFLC
jgi:hypothetical protein